jgi:hypothetical protein
MALRGTPLLHLFSPFLQKKEAIIGGSYVWIARITCIHSSGSSVHTQKKKVNYTSYHRYYSPRL